MFSQRVLVALDTGQGVIYAQASGWDRVYLWWTFRNFHSLPQKVLNPRQQQLIGSLYRQASNPQGHQTDGVVVIGTVDDFDPSSLSIAPISVKARKPAAATARKKSADVTAPDRKQPFYAQLVLNRMALRVGAMALVVIIAILAWRQLAAQPVSDSGSQMAAPERLDERSAVVNDPRPATVDLSSNPVAALASTGPVANPEPIAAPEVIAKQPAKSSDVSTRREADIRTAQARRRAAAPPTVQEASADQPRMQISGRPQKLVYPVCPDTYIPGKVFLQAVVGYDGVVNRVRVLTGDRKLAAAAVEAVRQWRYEPSSSAVQSLERETNITVSFISNEVVAVSFPSSASVSR